MRSGGSGPPVVSVPMALPVTRRAPVSTATGGGRAGGAAEEQPGGAREGPPATKGPRRSLPSAARGPRAGRAGWGSGAALGSQTGRAPPYLGGCGGGRAELWPRAGRGPRYGQRGRCSRLGPALAARGSPAERGGVGVGKLKLPQGEVLEGTTAASAVW